MGKINTFKCLPVGYGDIVPTTHLGRLTCIFACIGGVVMLSLLVSALTTSTEVTPKEDLVYDAIISERAMKNELRTDAAVVIKDFMVLTRLKKR